MSFHTVMEKPQTKFIAEHLRKRGSISALEASTAYKVRSLSRRINDLEANGFKVERRWCKDETGQRYVRYFFTGGPV